MAPTVVSTAMGAGSVSTGGAPVEEDCFVFEEAGAGGRRRGGGGRECALKWGRAQNKNQIKDALFLQEHNEIRKPEKIESISSFLIGTQTENHVCLL